MSVSLRPKMKEALRFFSQACLGIMLAALVFEAAVRLFIPVSDVFWESDPVIGMKLIPNKRGRSIKRELFDVPVQINSHGFREREHAWEKPAGTMRVVLLGDSYIEALQVPFEQSVPALLEGRLRAAGIEAETINLGVSSLGTARQYLVLREYGLRYKPDLVLLFFVGNDLTNNSARIEGTPYFPYPVPNNDGSLARDDAGRPRFTPIIDTRSRLAFLTGFLKHYSQSYRLLRATLEGSPPVHAALFRIGLMSTPPAGGGGQPADFGLHEIYRVQDKDAWIEAWTLTENFLLDIKRLANENGAWFAVVLVPAPWEVYSEIWERMLARVPAMRQAALDLDKPSRRLTAFLDAHRIAHMNLLPAFRQRAGELPRLYFFPDSHWTSEGHRLAADLLASPVATMLRDR